MEEVLLPKASHVPYILLTHLLSLPVHNLAYSVVPFIQVLHTLNPALARDPDRYLPIMKRLAEPERVLMFRVPWVDDAGNVQVITNCCTAWHVCG